ncbi:hypothetical protein BGZ73_004615 [Actinomortierella ambigua]|nr:hypothetical protein BGZ73_004615 [Actinomortierella ambigua]
MASRTATVRTTRTSTSNSTSTSQQNDIVAKQEQDRCHFCKKFLPAVKAECRFCRHTFCMEHRHPETHSPEGCAQRAREQSQQEYHRDSTHILGMEARNRGSTHQAGWNMEGSRQALRQKLNQRVQGLREGSGRAGGSAGGSGTGGGSGKGKKKGGSGSSSGSGSGHKWGSGGQRLGGTPSSAS